MNTLKILILLASMSLVACGSNPTNDTGALSASDAKIRTGVGENSTLKDSTMYSTAPTPSTSKVSTIDDLTQAALIFNSEVPPDTIGLMCNGALMARAVAEAAKGPGPASVQIPDGIGPFSDLAHVHADVNTFKAKVQAKAQTVQDLITNGIPQDLLVGCGPLYAAVRANIAEFAAWVTAFGIAISPK